MDLNKTVTLKSWKALFQIFLLLIYCVGLILLSSKGQQNDFKSIILPYSLCFIIYLFCSFHYQFSNWILLILALVTRSLLFISFPNLSDDIYRYWWDGMLLAHGYNPFEFTPNEVLQANLITDPKINEIFNYLNSPNYHTVYPAFCQVLFFIAYSLTHNDIYWFALLLKLFTLLIEFGGIYFLHHLLSSRPGYRRLFILYLFNPLLLIESYVNLHFELIQCSFLIIGIYYFFNSRSIISGSFYGLSILTKITPLIFAPLFLFRKKFIFLQFAAITLIILSFQLPFLISQLSTLGGYALYFKQFEFNSSLFFLLSKALIFFQCPELWNFRGLILLVFFLISNLFLLFFFRNKINEPQKWWGMAFIIYLVFIIVNSTVHPWYILPLFIIGLFSFPVTAIAASFIFYLSYSFYDPRLTIYFDWTRLTEYFLLLLCFGIEYYTRPIKSILNFN